MIMKNKLTRYFYNIYWKLSMLKMYVPLYAFPLIIPYTSHVLIALTLSYLN